MFFDSICTISDVQQLEEIIDILRNTLYQINKQSWQEALDNKIGVDWREDFSVPEPDRSEFLAKLENQISKLKVLRLTVAVSLPRASIRRICAWARKNVAPEVILDLVVDPQIVAGAEISWAGKYVDMSKQTALDQLLKPSYGI